MISVYSYCLALVATATFSTFASPLAKSSNGIENSNSSVASTAPDTVRLKVEGMTCGGCAVSARIVLQRLDGVVKAEVDYDTKIALVVFNSKVVSPERMIHALNDKLKYTATVLPPKVAGQ